MAFNPEQRCGLCGKRCRDHADRVDHERECEAGIVVSHDYPPIPVRELDYSAHLPDYDGAPDAGWQPVGTGPTREAAIADLKMQIEDHEP